MASRLRSSGEGRRRSEGNTRSPLFRASRDSSSLRSSSENATGTDTESEEPCDRLEALLSHDEAQLSSYFAWCCDRHIEENVLFLIALSAVNWSGEDSAARAREIVANFIAPGSCSEINISQDVRERISEALKNPSATAANVFEEARLAVKNALLLTWGGYEESQHFSDYVERSALNRNVIFGEDELANFWEQKPVKRIVKVSADIVAATLQDPMWWSRDDKENTTTINSVVREVVGGSLSIRTHYTRAVEARVAGMTFKNTMAATQYDDMEQAHCIWIHFRDIQGGVNLICRFHVLCLENDSCIVAEREWVHAKTGATILLKLGKKKVEKVRMAHLNLLESKASERRDKVAIMDNCT